jgi:hypothetical protein
MNDMSNDNTNNATTVAEAPKKAKRVKIPQNAIYVTPGDSKSGLLPIADLASAQAFRERFRNGSYTVPADSPQATELATYVGVTQNPDGSITRPEVFDDQGNGYDSYANGIGGFMRRNQAYNMPPQALAKIVLIALDALHDKALSQNDAQAADAQNVLKVVREFDGVASQQAEARLAQQKRERAIQALVDATGNTREAVEALLDASLLQAPVQVPDAPVLAEESPAESPKGSKGKGKGKHRAEEPEAVEAV